MSTRPVLFVLLTEQEKEEGGEFYSIQRLSPDLASEGEFGYDHFYYDHLGHTHTHTQHIIHPTQFMW